MEISVHTDEGVELFASVLGDAPVTVVFSAGIADRLAVRPLGERLAARYRVVLPDIRGVGQSVCADPARLGWSRYVADLEVLLDQLEVDRAVVAGAGMGSTIALRAGVDLADRILALVAAGVEAFEIDEHAQRFEAVFSALAERVENEGLAATWGSLLPAYPPFIQAMVGDSIQRTDASSAAAIFRMLVDDRAFDAVADLAAISAPTLVIPAEDERHPAELAVRCAQTIPNATLAATSISNELSDAADYARAVAPRIIDFIERIQA